MGADARKIFAQNLTAYMNRAGKTQSDLQAYMKCSSSTVSDWCNGNKYPRPDKMQRISEFLGVLMSDLTSDKSETTTKIVPPGFEPMPHTVKVPLVGEIACGEPILAEENIVDYVSVVEHWNADFALKCVGDSMEPKIKDGDIVAIRKQPLVENGQIAAVRIGDEATLKKVYLYSDHVILQPVNTAYEPIALYMEEMNDVTIEGKAVGLCRSL